MSPRTPACAPKNAATPPPTSHPRLLLSEVSTLDGVNSTWVLIRPRPARAYGRTGPIFGMIMALLIRVSTFDDRLGAVPKKSLAYASSSSNPSTRPVVPSDTPKFSFLFSQFVICGQLASPPKSYPMNGLTKAWARACVGAPTMSASARTENEMKRRFDMVNLRATSGRTAALNARRVPHESSAAKPESLADLVRKALADLLSRTR